MSKFIRFSTKLTLSVFATLFLFSCSKDADLLSEYVITTDDTQFENALLINDSFYMAEGQTTILMDVLNNDNVSSNSNITIIETSSPINGFVTINDDNTLTYKIGDDTSPEETTPEETTPEETTPEETTPEETTPEETTPEETTPAPEEDTFTYTAEVVNEETGERTEEQATVTISVNDNGPVKAFPSAYGGGSNATGGRGKALAIINTLDRNKALTYFPAENGKDEYYEGGLFPAMQNENVGYIVFNISGNIELGVGGTQAQFGYDGMYGVNNKTIFGQSAPQGGITLTGGSFRLDGRHGDNENLIFRYLRSRPIYDKDGIKRNIDGIADDDSYTWAFLFYGGKNIMLSNCSASFSYDKLVGAYIDEIVVAEGNGINNLTIQNCLLADGHTNVAIGVNSNKPNNPENFVDNVSFNNNAIIGGNRTPNISYNGNAEVINNLIYDSPSKMMNTYYQLNLNHIGNWHGRPASNSTVSHAHQELGLNKYPVIFTEGNSYEGFNYYSNANSDNTSIWVDFYKRENKLSDSFFTNSKHAHNNIPNQLTPNTAQQTYNEMIVDRNIGANKFLDNSGEVQVFLDSNDSKLLDIVANRTEKTWHQVSEWILPNIPSNSRPNSYDSDNDGMADAWEIRTFGNLNQSYKGDFDGDGYENIEEYMNQVDSK
ncbi:hypothetical protein SAMN04488007_3329 [Maribacter aquivivus]|uniref:Pectate lyase C n=1 Tax=Maribacter aquivivus TaxID=228958 RepID=A0A1M6TRC3_9FLAO|nr:hypothetical protein [Maribacter aquivivus]SHK59449.1 hypothetical protein SAMN04488007_3329 [Maribacter aquivivus]